MIELKPCPFCGSKASLFVNDGIRVICSKCKASTKILVDDFSSTGVMGNATESVIEYWNMRADCKYNK